MLRLNLQRSTWQQARQQRSEAQFEPFEPLDLKSVYYFGEVEKLRNGKPNPNFGKPLNSNFGRITATRGPREIQFALKFSF